MRFRRRRLGDDFREVQQSLLDQPENAESANDREPGPEKQRMKVMQPKSVARVLLKAIAGRLERLQLRCASFTELNALSKPAFNPDFTAHFSSTGFCFIHIPKNGGTTIEKLLYEIRVHHRPWHELYYLAPREFENWTKFCVIRDPVDRFLSSYDYLKRGGRNMIDAEVGRRFIHGVDINSFVRKFQQAHFKNQIMQYFHFRPQSEFILSADGHCMVNRLISFDNLNIEMGRLLNIDSNDIEYRNTTRGPRTTAIELSESSKDLIESLYQRDVELYYKCKSKDHDFYLQKLTI